jgi:tRNA-specific 2-thiouridylase
MMETIFVAMSGGFDSFLAAYLLKKAGHRVVGVTFTLFEGPLFDSWDPPRSGSRSAADEARNLCRDLGLPHHVVDLSDVFAGRVIEPFIEGYRRGTTPNPCVLCNRFVKFGAFHDRAVEMGADMVATGHYARAEHQDGDVLLKKGGDANKDQSYFLYSIDRQALLKTVFPLGGYTREGLLVLARNEGLRPPGSRPSQDVCFLAGRRYTDFLSRFIKPRQGRVYLVDGTLLGRHEGIHLFTIGQRRGINLPYREALYVVDIRADENTVVVGTKADLTADALTARDVSIRYPLGEGLSARVRYRQPDRACTCAVRGDTLSVRFTEPVDGVTPGQSVVLYRDDIVAGGGVIEKRVALEEAIL